MPFLKNSRNLIIVIYIIIVLCHVPLLAQEPVANDSVPASYDTVYMETIDFDSVRALHGTPAFFYSWVSYQMKVTLETPDEKLGFQCFFVNRTDSLIYFNLHKSGIELARVVLTPDSVIYVNKLNKEFYRGGYKFLEKMLGLPLDFQMVQSILLARDFPHFENNLVYVEGSEGDRYISPLRKCNEGDKSIMQTITLNDRGRIAKQDITDLKSYSNVKVFYDDWYDTPRFIDHPAFQKSLQDRLYFFNKIRLLKESEGVSMDIELKNLKIDQPGPTSIRIPDSFTEISF